MDFDLGKEERHICEQLSQLDQAELSAYMDILRSQDIAEARGAMLHGFSAIKGTGYVGFVFDGKGMGPAVTAVREKLATVSTPLFLSLEAGNGLLVRLLKQYGAEKQQDQLLSALVSCKAIGSVAVIEEHGNIEDNPFQSALVKEKEKFVLSGRKWFVINAPMADWIAVACAMEETFAFALVSGNAHGLSIGPRLSLMGLEGTPFYSIDLNHVTVSPGQVIGPLDSPQALRQLRRWEDEILVSASLGIMRRAYESARDHAKSHKCGGKPLVVYQEIGFKLAEMLTLLQTAQLLAYRAAWMAKVGDREADVVLHCAKVFCAESAEKIASGAVQILGGQGLVRGNPAEQAYRDSKYIHIAGISTERSRMKIGDRVLEVY